MIPPWVFLRPDASQCPDVLLFEDSARRTNDTGPVTIAAFGFDAPGVGKSSGVGGINFIDGKVPVSLDGAFGAGRGFLSGESNGNVGESAIASESRVGESPGPSILTCIDSG